MGVFTVCCVLLAYHINQLCIISESQKIKYAQSVNQAKSIMYNHCIIKSILHNQRHQTLTGTYTVCTRIAEVDSS